MSRRCKDCACAIHVIQDDRTVLSVKFDNVDDGFVQRGIESRRVYDAVEDFIAEQRQIYRDPVAEVGTEGNLDIVNEDRLREFLPKFSIILPT